jgi:hypothetical protein
MAHVTKLSITLDTTSNNSSTGGYFYSETSPNGFVHAVEYVRGTNAFASTGVLELYVGSTLRELIHKTITTDSWIVYPRKSLVDSTAAAIGASTDFPVACIPLSGTDLIVAGITGGTSGAQDGDVFVYVEGV